MSRTLSDSDQQTDRLDPSSPPYQHGHVLAIMLVLIAGVIGIEGWNRRTERQLAADIQRVAGESSIDASDPIDLVTPDASLNVNDQRLANRIAEQLGLAHEPGLGWPGFRGVERVSRQTHSLIDPAWDRNPPRLLWRIEIGAGWSSFAVAGNIVFTQQVVADREYAMCYHGDTGGVIWSCEIASAFTDANGDTAARATPTISHSSLFVVSASGMLHRIDAINGQLQWSNDLTSIAQRDPPMFGFAGSPLVVDDIVIAFVGGTDDGGLIAFDVEDGRERWRAPTGDHSYGSPHPYTINERTMVAMLSNSGFTVVDPRTGAIQLQYDWPSDEHRSLQPHPIQANGFLLPSETGTRRIRVTDQSESWMAQDVWETSQLKPVFNDLVVHQGFAYGFDDTIFTCIDLDDGKATWKSGRYGHGQVLLLAASNLLLIATESGEVIVVAADADEHRELATLDAIEGRTFNHPVVVDDRLYVRNSQQAACFQLPTLDRVDPQRDDTSSR